MSSKTQDRYTMMILEALSDTINDLGEELQEDNNLTEFFHALSNLAPTMIYCEITGNPTNVLQFNHLANQLIYQNKK